MLVADPEFRSYTRGMNSDAAVHAIERPHASLWTYYILSSFLLGPLFFLALIPLYFRYHTMRYRFDGEGISMRWGILFRREINLTYARIQDIHLVSNVVERWLGLARIQVQTASGSANAELTIEGIREYEMLRDYLYSQMRGIRGNSAGTKEHVIETGDELAATLNLVAAEMRETNRLLALLTSKEDR